MKHNTTQIDDEWIDDLLESIWMLGVEHQTFTIPESDKRLEAAKATIQKQLKRAELLARIDEIKSAIELVSKNHRNVLVRGLGIKDAEISRQGQATRNNTAQKVKRLEKRRTELETELSKDQEGKD